MHILQKMVTEYTLKITKNKFSFMFLRIKHKGVNIYENIGHETPINVGQDVSFYAFKILVCKNVLTLSSKKKSRIADVVREIKAPYE